MFKLITEPASFPLADTKESYIKQNELLKYTRFLYTSFEGIILSDLFYTYSMPSIKKGSVVLFCNSIYLAEKDMPLADESEEDGYRYIKLTNENIKTLSVSMTDSIDVLYDYEKGGYYGIDRDGRIYKYLNFEMRKRDGGYFDRRCLKRI